MGIAEANMMGVAAGLATCGKMPFANSFAMFATGRAWEQVRNSIAYPRLNVKVVGSHGGLSVARTAPPISASRTTPSCGPSPACWWSPPVTPRRCARR